MHNVMVPWSIQHATNVAFRQLPRCRCDPSFSFNFTTASRFTSSARNQAVRGPGPGPHAENSRPWKPKKIPRGKPFTFGVIDPYILESLESMDVLLPSDTVRSVRIHCRRGLDLTPMIRLKYCAGHHIVRNWDPHINRALMRASSIARLAHYKTRKAEKLLWVDYFVQGPPNPAAYTCAKRKTRHALINALKKKGLGFDGKVLKPKTKGMVESRESGKGGQRSVGAGKGEEGLKGTLAIIFTDVQKMKPTKFAELESAMDELVEKMLGMESTPPPTMTVKSRGEGSRHAKRGTFNMDQELAACLPPTGPEQGES